MAFKSPFYMYRPGSLPVFITDEAMEERHKKDGFSKKYVHSHFPKMLYGPKGETIKVETESEMQVKIAEGYGEDFVDKPKAETAKEVARDGREAEKLNHIKGRVEDHDHDLEDLSTIVKDLSEAVKNQLDELGALRAEVEALKTATESLT